MGQLHDKLTEAKLKSLLSGDSDAPSKNTRITMNVSALDQIKTKRNKPRKPRKPNWFKRMLTKIKNFIANFWSNKVVNKLNKKRETSLKAKELELIKKRFEYNFNTTIDKQQNLINYRSSGIAPLVQTDINYLDEKLVEGRRHIINNVSKKSPLFYEPEICDIHNENPFKKDNPTLDMIKAVETTLSGDLLRDQANGNKERDLKSKIKKLLITRG